MNSETLYDYSELDPMLIPYYLSGERVEVLWKKGYEIYSGYGCRTNGQIGRFYVSLSTGWRPIFISLFNKNSTGGLGISSNSIDQIRGLGKTRRIYNNEERLRKFVKRYDIWKRLVEAPHTVTEDECEEMIYR